MLIPFILAMSMATLPAPRDRAPARIVEDVAAQRVMLADFSGDVRDGSARQAMLEAFARLDRALAARHIRRRAASLPMAAMTRFDDETGVLTGAVAYAVDEAPRGQGAGVRSGETPAGRLVRFETHAVFGKANPEYEDFVAWISKHQLHPRAEAWEVYARPGQGAEPPLTYVYYPLP